MMAHDESHDENHDLGQHQSMSVLEKYGLRYVINVSGTMTSLGASLVNRAAIADGALMQAEFVSMDELQRRAGEAIARATGAEAGCVTACSAAAMTLCTAGAMTGAHLARIEQLPDTEGMNHEVVVPAGHLVHYGAPVEQSIRLAGARPVAVGSAALSRRYHLEHAIGEHTAAALFVVSHHVVQEGQILMEDFVEVCKARGVPVIVDMASEQDLTGPVALGADGVIYSAHKFLQGPTAGLIAGTKAMVRAAYLQNRGIGRQMKVGKEGIAGAIAALQAWEQRDHGQAHRKEQAIVSGWQESLGAVPGLALALHDDWTGNPIVRLKITLDPDRAGLFAWELADRLAAGTPAIAVRDDLVEHGCIFLDPCNLRPGCDEEQIVARRIGEVVKEALARGDGRRVSLSQRRQQADAAALGWPD